MLCENIKAIRKSKGLSQEELAVKLNVVRQTVSKWEKRPVRAGRGPADPAGGGAGHTTSRLCWGRRSRQRRSAAEQRSSWPASPSSWR